MNPQKKKTCMPSLILWLLVIVYMLFRQVAAPMGSDDWYYRCTEWLTIVPDATREYMVTNPRLPSTILTRVLSLSPWYVVDVANAMAYFLVCWLMMMFAFGKMWRQYALRWEMPLLLGVLTLCLIPKSSDLFFWHCGVAFYSWPLVYNLMMLLWFRNILADGEEVGAWTKVWLLGVPLALLASMGMYGVGGMTFLVACATWYVSKRRGKDGDCRKLLVLASFLLVGLAAVVLAPGNFHRVDMVAAVETNATAAAVMSTVQSPQARFWRLLPGVLPGALMLLFLGWLFVKNCIKKSWSRQDLVFIGLCLAAAVIMAVPVMILPVKAPSRAYAGSYIALCIAALRLVYALPEMGRSAKAFFRLALVVPVFLAVVALPKQKDSILWWLALSKGIDQPACEVYEVPYSPTPEPYVSEHHHWYGSFLKCFNCQSVREKSVRCTYNGGDVAKAVLTDAPLNYLYSSHTDGKSGGTLSLELSSSDLPACVYVAYRDVCTAFPYAVEVDAFLSSFGSHDTASREELEKAGWVVCSAEKDGESYRLSWDDYPPAWRRPHCPDIWVAVPETDRPLQFRRVVPTPAWR